MASIILVAGMHRSGTSALTRCINLAGVPLPARLMPADPDNADGYWESADLYYLHNAILTSLQSAWNDPREIPEAWFSGPASAAAGAQLVAWLAEEMRGKDALLVKDPRVCRLLPLWRHVASELGLDVRTIITVRNPIEVARSLATRDGFSEPHSYFLWLRHVLDAERFSRSTPRSFVTFDQLMADPLGTVRKVSRDLDAAFPTPEAKLRPLLDATLKPSLRHHTVADAALAEVGEQLPALLTTYRWVLDAAADKSPDTAPLDEITATMRASEQSRGMAIVVPPDTTTARPN
ncbi:MAG TPA: hypothetical protein VL966_17915 [Alphaproteobacteria bacterium]|jgi:hypothetical protein|nr:hypothetical protein [Alphaproteobacteria bacterium]